MDTFKDGDTYYWIDETIVELGGLPKPPCLPEGGEGPPIPSLGGKAPLTFLARKRAVIVRRENMKF